MTGSLGCPPNSLCTPQPSKSREPPPGPSRPPLYSLVKQSKRRGDAPITGPLPLGSLGLLWHRPLSPQQAKVGGWASPHRDPVSGDASGTGGGGGGRLPAGRGGGRPPPQWLEQRGKRAAPAG